MTETLVQINHELINYILSQYNYTDILLQQQQQQQQQQIVKKYKPRSNVKSTEHERMRSREYYIANRELILQKRRIHAAKLKKIAKA
jgi:ABC-type transporter lipoprotein component MlaA